MPIFPSRRVPAIAVAVPLLSLRAAAAEPVTRITIDCPLLAAEPRGALEARAHTDLMARGESGTLAIACTQEAVHLAFHADRGATSEATAPLASDPRLSVDAALEALDALLNGVDSPTAPGAHVTGELLPPLPGGPASQPPDSSNEAISGVATSRGNSASLAPAYVYPSGYSAAARAAVAAGATFELWSASAVGALGPSARAQLLLASPLSVDAGASIAWTLGSPLGVTGRIVDVFAGVEYAFDDARRFRAGVEGIASFLHVDRDVASVPATASHGSAAGRVRASYALPLYGQTALVLGPAVTIRPAELSVRFGTREAFGVPNVTVGAAVELRLGSL